MKLAVLMSTYNGEKYLKEQINSILAQKVNFHFDLIVRDDGSTDNTLKILDSYSQKKELTYYVGRNVGPANSFISLLRKVRHYDFYAFSDQDDIWHIDKLQKGVNSLLSLKKPAIYFSNGLLVDSELNSLGRNTHKNKPICTFESILCGSCSAQGCTSIFNAQLAELIQNCRYPEFCVMHDSFLTSLCKLVDGVIIYDDFSSIKYRMHSNNVCGVYISKGTFLFKIYDKIKRKIYSIIKKKEISFFDQCECLLNVYGSYISEINKNKCKAIIMARSSIISRIKLVLNKNIKSESFTYTLTKKIEILIGNL